LLRTSSSAQVTVSPPAACRHDEGRLLLPNVTRVRIPEHRELYLSGPRLAAGEPK
jgi:hypothetical protein